MNAQHLHQLKAITSDAICFRRYEEEEDGNFIRNSVVGAGAVGAAGVGASYWAGGGAEGAPGGLTGAYDRTSRGYTRFKDYGSKLKAGAEKGWKGKKVAPGAAAPGIMDRVMAGLKGLKKTAMKVKFSSRMNGLVELNSRLDHVIRS